MEIHGIGLFKMKFLPAVLAVLACAGCSSASAPAAQGLTLHQKTEVKCVASNVKPNGCKTEHELWIVAPLSSANPGLPSADDLRDPDAGSEF